MPLMPFSILGIWLRGLLALAILSMAGCCAILWYNDSWLIERTEVVHVDSAPPGTGELVVTRRVRESVSAGRGNEPSAGVAGPSAAGARSFRWALDWDRRTAELAGALVLLAWAFSGRWIGEGLHRYWHAARNRASRGASGGAAATDNPSARAAGRARVEGPDWLPDSGPIADQDPQPDPPQVMRTGQVHRIRRPDGSELWVETRGPQDAQPIVFTHGWGADSDEWCYQKRHLAGRYRLIVWDLPGLGFSTQPDNRDFSLEKMARDLDAVLKLAGGRPALLVGHSIGGMILLTFCRLFPESLGTRVAGLAIVHSSCKDPIQTVKNAWLFQALRVPVLIPLLHLTIAVWPLVSLMNWLSYWNGSLERSTRKQSFRGPGTPAQVRFLARFMARARPDVMARGMFGMMAFDETATLPKIRVPTVVLIGDQDEMTVPQAGEFIARSIPTAVPVVLSPAQHLGLFEYHSQFNQILAEFAELCTDPGTMTFATIVTRTGS